MTQFAKFLYQDQVHDPNKAAIAVPLLEPLDAVVAGSRDPALANDPALDPLAAAELQLLLESLSTPA